MVTDRNFFIAGQEGETWTKFYQLSKEETRKKVNGQQEPLTDQQVMEHQEKYGKNELVEGKKKSTFQIFLEQYKDFLVIILIAAAIVSGFLGDAESAIVILVVITMNAILGTVQTVKAEQSLNSLKKLSGPTAKVLRNGNVIQIPSVELTVGDEVMLEAGDYVPADGRILQNASLKIDESALTGESLGVEKSDEVISGEVPLGDQTNMVFSGSFVTYGRGSFLVTGIGMETEVGKIATLLKTTSEKRTPLQINLDQFWTEIIYHYFNFLWYFIWNQCIPRRFYRRCIPLCSCPCSSGNPRGIKPLS